MLYAGQTATPTSRTARLPRVVLLLLSGLSMTVIAYCWRPRNEIKQTITALVSRPFPRLFFIGVEYQRGRSHDTKQWHHHVIQWKPTLHHRAPRPRRKNRSNVR